MKNLEIDNIIIDDGESDINIVKEIEIYNDIKLPAEYTNFITKHDGASILARSFNFFDNNLKMQSSESIAFIKIDQINDDINSLLKQSTNDPEDPDVFKFYHYFYEKMIPYGDTGGGDFICFDYRNYNGNNPPIVLWCHDANDSEGRISFIANNFEEFINMLHEPED